MSTIEINEGEDRPRLQVARGLQHGGLVLVGHDEAEGGASLVDPVHLQPWADPA
jgi:hypothetical protein